MGKGLKFCKIEYHYIEEGSRDKKGVNEKEAEAVLEKLEELFCFTSF